MRTALLLACCMLLLAACHKGGGDPEIKDAYELKQNPAWETENFKNNYTIQFPPGYTGNGMIGFEGNIFDKRNEEKAIYFSYGFCSPTFCYDFGDTLKNTAQETFTGIFYGIDTLLLTQRINFTLSRTLTGIFYHSDDTVSYGKLFWKDGGVIKEALDVNYRKEYLQQVTEIIGSIRHK